MEKAARHAQRHPALHRRAAEKRPVRGDQSVTCRSNGAVSCLPAFIVRVERSGLLRWFQEDLVAGVFTIVEPMIAAARLLGAFG